MKLSELIEKHTDLRLGCGTLLKDLEIGSTLYYKKFEGDKFRKCNNGWRLTIGSDDVVLLIEEKVDHGFWDVEVNLNNVFTKIT